MLDSSRRARLLHVAIWLATLFFTAMLFVPLLREALRRVTDLPSADISDEWPVGAAPGRDE